MASFMDWTWGEVLQKPDEKWKHWHSMRARDQARRVGAKSARKTLKLRQSHIVELWDGEEIQQAICTREPICPPSELCLHNNKIETLKFLSELRERLAIKLKDGLPEKRVWLRKNPQEGRLPRIGVYSDYSKIDRISTSAAVILASEYDRAGRIMGSVPPAIDIHKWSEGAFTTLFELGFFDLIGHTGKQRERYESITRGNTLTLRMRSGENGNQLEPVSDAVVELVGFINNGSEAIAEQLIPLNTAIGEAMINVRRHAYQEPFEPRQAYVPRWWFTASADRASRRITAVLYDQGATIPVTLPKHKNWFDWIVNALAGEARCEPGTERRLQNLLSDDEAIRYAMREGTTQTDEPGRGKGLPQMLKLIGSYGAGDLMVMSRNGLFKFGSDAGTYQELLPYSIGGTLVEWEIEVPSK